MVPKWFLRQKVGYLRSLFFLIFFFMRTEKVALAPGSCHLRAAQEGAGNVLGAREDLRLRTRCILGLKAEGEGRWQRGQEAKATPISQAFSYALSKFLLRGPGLSQATLLRVLSSNKSAARSGWGGGVEAKGLKVEILKPALVPRRDNLMHLHKPQPVTDRGWHRA